MWNAQAVRGREVGEDTKRRMMEMGREGKGEEDGGRQGQREGKERGRGKRGREGGRRRGGGEEGKERTSALRLNSRA